MYVEWYEEIPQPVICLAGVRGRFDKPIPPDAMMVRHAGHVISQLNSKLVVRCDDGDIRVIPEEAGRVIG